MREGSKVRKKRIYLGRDLSLIILSKKESDADSEFKTIKISKNLKPIKEKIIPILKKNKVKHAGIFGSYARGEQNKNSDIDIIIEPVKGMGFRFAGLEAELSKKLKKKVDLVSYNGLSPHIRDRILSQEIEIL